MGDQAGSAGASALYVALTEAAHWCFSGLESGLEGPDTCAHMPAWLEGQAAFRVLYQEFVNKVLGCTHSFNDRCLNKRYVLFTQPAGIIDHLFVRRF